jgi:flavin-dependent dehydrogenase
VDAAPGVEEDPVRCQWLVVGVTPTTVMSRGVEHESCDVLIIGGGPAGSSCAWKLAQNGLDVRVLDRARFPRDKTCAGWITPAVVDLLDLDVDDYCSGNRTFQVIKGFRTSRMGMGAVTSCYDHPVSFGIRRCEFDDYLLRRSGARLDLGESVQSIRRDKTPTGMRWIINERIVAPMLVGAGGHYCPVARFLGADGPSSDSQGSGSGDARHPGFKSPPDRTQRDRWSHGLIVAQEVEFVMTTQQQAACKIDPERPELYFCDDLGGYGWCFRKKGVLNIGLGRRGGDGRRLSGDIRAFVTALRTWGKIDFDLPDRLRGHAYLLSDGSPRRRVDDGVVLIGDSAGIAYPASGEGIRPAIESGLLAAEVIVAAAVNGCCGRQDLETYRKRLEARFGRPKPPRHGWPAIPQGWQSALAGRLLAWPWFARHVVMEHLFLHTHEPPLRLDPQDRLPNQP